MDAGRRLAGGARFAARWAALRARLRVDWLGRYWLRSYFVVLAVTLPLLRASAPEGIVPSAFALAVWGTYGALYLVPALLLTWAVQALLVPWRRLPALWRERGVASVAVLSTSLSVFFLFADARIHRLYGFHVNGFVLNLVSTPGGIESMGASRSTYATVMGLALAILGLQAMLLWHGRRERRCPRLLRSLARARVWLPLLLVISAAERFTFGVAHLRAYSPVLSVASQFPLYSSITFNGLAKRLGFEAVRRPTVPVPAGSGRLAYPAATLEVERPERPLNVVWIVAESLRADALDEEIMPALWRFARDSARFTHHHSGGNGTRMGVFTMFYGLLGTYWFPMLEERRGPVLLSALREQGYRFEVHTSAKFTYPEFDRTVFVDMDLDELRTYGEGQTWERDRASIDRMLEFLRAPDERPFFAFAFMESPHAAYAFPEDSIVRRPYLEDLNYAAMSLEEDIDGMRNRYLNACHHLDGQLARVFDELEASGHLDDTIVLVTGDHGEEFLEHGHWGHGSTFVDEQIRVPLVLRVPGEEPRVVERMTSHVDIAPTLLPLLGIRNPPDELALGNDLLGSEERDYAVVVDWSRVCIVGATARASFPFKVAGSFREEAEGTDEASPQDPETLARLARVLRDMGRFLRK